MEKMKILIATSNEGKFREISAYFSNLPYLEFVSLKNLETIALPEETEETIEDNAMLKAKYYADKTGLMALSDDSGLFIEALAGWPGVYSARQGNSDDERMQLVLEKMTDIPEENRQAVFRSVLALWDPKLSSSFLAFGEVRGKILVQPTAERIAGFGYDPIFFDIVAQKVNSHMTVEEKNKYSHRGQALEKMKSYLQNFLNIKH